jgi:ArsR family transcriptional regulator
MHDDAPWQADLFRVLGEPNRLRIVRHLFRGPAPVGEIAAALGAEQSLVSHHLAALRRSGMVASRREGRSVRYALSVRARGALRGQALDLGCCVVTFRRAAVPGATGAPAGKAGS